MNHQLKYGKYKMHCRDYEYHFSIEENIEYVFMTIPVLLNKFLIARLITIIHKRTQ